MESFLPTIRKGTHLLFFGATWCSNCKQTKKEISEIDIKDTIVHIYDVDQDKEITAICGITSLPTIQVWTDGRFDTKFEGAKQCEICLIVYKNFTKDYVQNVDETDDF